MDDTFAKFGFQFQAKLISLFITDRDFSKQIADSLDVKLFENDSLRWIVDNSLKYFREYKLQPTLEVFKVQISNLQEGSLLRTEVISTLREVFKSLDATDKQFVKDETVKFLRHKEYENAVVNIIPLLQKGLYEEAESLFIAAGKKVQLEQDFGLDYLEDIDYRYTEQAQKKKIPTGFKVLDDIMGGGLPIGKMGIAMAGTGVGKCVGPNTKIDIEYEEIGIELIGVDGNIHIIWMKPWDEVMLNDYKYFAWQLEHILN